MTPLIEIGSDLLAISSGIKLPQSESVHPRGRIVRLAELKVDAAALRPRL